jgi:hypothetical protein
MKKPAAPSKHIRILVSPQGKRSSVCHEGLSLNIKPGPGDQEEAASQLKNRVCLRLLSLRWGAWNPVKPESGLRMGLKGLSCTRRDA